MGKEPTPADIANLEKEQREAELQAEFDAFEQQEKQRLAQQKRDDDDIIRKEKLRKQLESEKETGIRKTESDRISRKEELRKQLRTEYESTLNEKDEVKRKTEAEDKRQYDLKYKTMEKYTGNPFADRIIGGALKAGGSYLDNTQRGGIGGRSTGRVSKSAKGKSTPKKQTGSNFSSGISLHSVNTPTLSQPITRPAAQPQRYQPQRNAFSLGFPPIGGSVPKQQSPEPKRRASTLPLSVIPKVKKSAPDTKISLNMGKSIFGGRKTNPVNGKKKKLFRI